jgi:hypothetical protein
VAFETWRAWETLQVSPFLSHATRRKRHARENY